MEQKVRECVKQIRKITDFEPQAALILGSGLGALADEIECVASIDYHEIPGFPVSTVAGHNGRFVFGTAANPLSHEEVKEVADRVAPKFKTLVKSAIERMC